MLRWKWAKINLAPLLLGKAAPSLPSRRNLYLDVEITCVFSADFLHMEEVLQNGRKPEKHTFSLLLKLSNWTFFLSPIPRILWVCTVHTSINGFSALFYGHTLRFHLSRYDFFGRRASLTPLVRLRVGYFPLKSHFPRTGIPEKIPGFPGKSREMSKMAISTI